MKKLFADNEVQESFVKDGYVVIPFLNSSKLAEVLSFYKLVGNEHEITSPVHSTSDTNNKELIITVDRKLKEIVAPVVDDVFYESKVFLSNFLVKESDPDSSILPHQDWTFVDESRFCSVSVWCPLTDINSSTGRIGVIKGSHKFIETLRASPDSPSAFSSVNPELHKYISYIEMKAGEALIYNHALIHASEPNLSEHQRPVAVWAITSLEADIFLHYYHPAAAKRKLERFKVDTEFFYNYAKHSRPNSKYSVGFIEYEFKQIARTDFLKAVGENTLERKKTKSFKERLKDFVRLNKED